MPDPEEEYKVYRDGCLYWEVRYSFHEEALFEMRPEKWVGLKQTIMKGDEFQAERIALLHILHQAIRPTKLNGQAQKLQETLKS